MAVYAPVLVDTIGYIQQTITEGICLNAEVDVGQIHTSRG